MMFILFQLIVSTFFNLLFFFFNDPATTEIYTLSYTTLFRSLRRFHEAHAQELGETALVMRGQDGASQGRSEEHTSELQSHSDLVCRLLLEKKKKHRSNRGS